MIRKEYKQVSKRHWVEVSNTLHAIHFTPMYIEPGTHVIHSVDVDMVYRGTWELNVRFLTCGSCLTY